MSSMVTDRRGFLGGVSASAALGFIPATQAAPVLTDIPDDGWQLWVDRDAAYAEDRIFLPDEVDLSALPVNPPSGGWDALWKAAAIAVSLPSTVEEHCWGVFGSRPYTGDEYRYAEDDPVPRNGAYRGVSWWYREIDIPAAARGRRVFLHLRGARLRAEIFLNERLVGYSIMSELPIHCDLTQAMRPGTRNRLAIRITNPGGRFDWRDSTTMSWGTVKLFASHGFGGLDRGLTLSAHPMDAHIADAWVLNTADPRTVTAHMEIAFASPPPGRQSLARRARLKLIGASGPQAARVTLEDLALRGNTATVRFRVEAPDARLWELEDPALYRIEFGWGEDIRTVQFGFRWFAPEGLGSDAMLRLNGRRIRLYSAISWGYWGGNGLWPTALLARREVTAAKALGLNCLHFHRNVGKPEVLAAQDAMGLLRVMEPGGGRHAIAKEGRISAADRFSRDFLVQKCVAMAKAFRSHPSLVQYSLQNEISADLSNPDVEAVLRAIHAADPSRTVILNDGFVARGAAQAMLLPYSDTLHRSDRTEWGGWWVNHQGAGDQWYDRFYRGPDDYVHRQTGKPYIVEFGEMQGCAVADNHAAMVREIESGSGRAYDLDDHHEILRSTEAFLDRWDFRSAFPTAERLFLSIGRKCYEAWENYLENIRLGESVDIACISGWESTAIENHSGIVDNLRGFKADPATIRRALLPIRPCARQNRLVYETGERATVDLYLFNDSGRPASGSLSLSITDPAGRRVEIGRYAAPDMQPDQFSALIAPGVALPDFATPGMHRLHFTHSAHPEAEFERAFWVVTPPVAPAPNLRIALSGVGRGLRAQLETLPGVHLEAFRPGVRYDAIISQGLSADEVTRREIGEQTGLEAQPKASDKPKLVPGRLADTVLAAVARGTPLLALVPEDGLADGVAHQLAGQGYFTYSGQVGNLRAPWMGNWTYLRTHPLFTGIPADCATSVFHQVEGQASNGLIVEGSGIEILAAYSRDHDRQNGAATMIVGKGNAWLLLHRMPDMVAPLQRRFLANAIALARDRAQKPSDRKGRAG